MGTRTRKLYAIGSFVVGLLLTAPVVWFYLYRRAHPDADISLVAAGFFGVVALIGLNMALRSLWIMFRG